MSRARTFGNLNGLAVWRSNITDRLKSKHVANTTANLAVLENLKRKSHRPPVFLPRGSRWQLITTYAVRYICCCRKNMIYVL